MSDDNSQTDGNRGIDGRNRRNILKSIGAGAAATTFSVGTAAARSRSRNADEDDIPWDFEMITGGEKDALLEDLREADAYQQLTDVVDEIGGTISDESEAARLAANDDVREVVSVEVESETDASLSLNIGRDRGEGVSVANVTEEHYADDGILEKKAVYDVLSDSDSSVSRGVSVQSTNAPATKKVVQTEDRVRSAIENAQAELEGDSSDRVSTQGLGDGACDECQWAAVLICQNGCGLGGGLACGILGITAIGGVACTTLVSVTCALAAVYSGCGDALADAACDEVGLC